MHHMYTEKTHREKARRKPYKNATSCIEQMLEATINKTTAKRPFTPTSLKSSKLDEKDMRNNAGKARMNS